LDPETLEQLKAQAELENENMTTIVKKAIRLYVSKAHESPVDKQRIVYKAKRLIEELELLVK